MLPFSQYIVCPMGLPLHSIRRELLRPSALQGYSRVVLIGHSYGCYLVNRLASTEEAREKVAAVILIGAGYPVAGYNRLRWIFYLPVFVSGSPLSFYIYPACCMSTHAACQSGGLTRLRNVQTDVDAPLACKRVHCTGAILGAAISDGPLHQAGIPP